MDINIYYGYGEIMDNHKYSQYMMDIMKQYVNYTIISTC